MDIDMDMQEFTCNICGASNNIEESKIHRELLPCANCGSSPRFRGVALCIQREFLPSEAQPLMLAEERRHIRGIGMSDAESYAGILDRIFDYKNTFYHQEPRLDVTKQGDCLQYLDLDFVISTDVFEHVYAPVTRALANLRSMLKPGGVLIFSVPYLEGYETIEHFPHLTDDHNIIDSDGSYTLVNRRLDGAIETMEHLSFHGGPGAVLELRVFGEGDLLASLAYAGFGSIEIVEPNRPEIGYIWRDAVEHHLHRGRKMKSYLMICRNDRETAKIQNPIRDGWPNFSLLRRHLQVL